MFVEGMRLVRVSHTGDEQTLGAVWRGRDGWFLSIGSHPYRNLVHCRSLEDGKAKVESVVGK